jgi:MoaA/NifB/PqqE/SkfB family radical SAM enzyme
VGLFKQAYSALAVRAGFYRPLYAHYGVTHRCNMRCRMCVVWRDGNAASEVPVDGVRLLAAGLTGAGVRMVALGGGEPFVRQDLPEIVDAFTKYGADVRLLTNGIGIADERIDTVIAAGVGHVSISLDTLDPEKEKDIYSGKDVWKEIVDTMRRFRARLKTPPAIPIMNVCVSRLNLEELPALVRFAVSEGFFCSFVPIALSPSEAESDGFAAVAPEFAVRPSDFEKVDAAYAELIRLKKRGAPIANSSRFLRDSQEFMRTGRANWRCDAGRLYFSVSPRGEIAVCHRFPPVAQFDTPDLSRKLLSADVRRVAAEQREGCDGCMRPCWAEVTHAVHDWRSSAEALRLAFWRPGSDFLRSAS